MYRARSVLSRLWSVVPGPISDQQGEPADAPLVTGAESAPPAAPEPPAPPSATTGRIDLANQLWGEGFLLPGGRAEAERLASLLPLSPATTLLLVGLDGGGIADLVVRARGAWVSVHQHDPVLAAQAAQRLRPLGRRAAVQTWNPAAPAFRTRFHHHAMAIEALRQVTDAAPLLAAIAAALKPGGQIVLVDLVAEQPEACPRRWLELEGRVTPPPVAAALEEVIQQAGFVIHVTEDAGARQSAAVLEAWSRLLHALTGTGRARGMAEALVTEAETWLLRQRLMASGTVRLLRWHASLTAQG